jgi:hypothetical protein
MRSAVTAIKPGTARRLGLRPPMSASMFIFGVELPEEKMQEARGIMDRWAARMMHGITKEDE